MTLILPLARLMKNLKAHSYFRGLKRFLPFSDPSEDGQGGRLRMTRMASFYCGKTRRTEIENVPCHSDPASCAAYEESQGTYLFSEIETFPAILGSFGGRAKGSAQDDENGFVLLR